MKCHNLLCHELLRHLTGKSLEDFAKILKITLEIKGFGILKLSLASLYSFKFNLTILTIWVEGFPLRNDPLIDVYITSTSLKSVYTAKSNSKPCIGFLLIYITISTFSYVCSYGVCPFVCCPSCPVPLYNSCNWI